MTYTSPTDHVLIASGGDEVQRGLVVGTRDELWHATVSALHADSSTHGIYALDLSSVGGGSDPTHCYPGMTLDIGTTPGARDVGMARIRFYNSTTTKVTIAETAPADLPVQVGHYVTARKEFLPWKIPKRIVLTLSAGVITAVTEYLDYDLAYSSGTHPFPTKSNITAGHNRDGTPKHVQLFGWEDTPGCGFRVVHLSALDSVIHNYGGTLASVLWDLQDCTYLGGGLPTDTEVDVVVPVGFRYIHLQVTDSYGKGDIFWRHMPLWCDVQSSPTMVLRNFNVTSDETEVGREMQFEFFGNANEADETVIPTKSLVCYFEEPSWTGGDTPPESYRKEALGWVTDDDPLLKLQASQYGIKVGSTQHWKQSFRANSVTLIDTGSTPTTYTEMQHMTVDRVADFSLIATDTLRTLVNVYYTGRTAAAEAITLPLGDAWSQIAEIIPRAALSTVGCDSYGNIFMGRPYSYLSDGQRAIVLEALSVSNTDWYDQEGLDLPTTNIHKVGLVTGSAEYWNSGRVIYASQAPGLREGDGIGSPKITDQVVDPPTPQGDLNRLTGLFYWHENNPRPTVTLIFFGNYDVIEPCWQQPILITWADPTLRGETLSATPFVVKHVSIAHTNSPDSSTPPKRITLTLEQATTGASGETAPVTQMTGMTQYVDTSCTVTAAFTKVVTVCDVAFTDTSTGDLILGWMWDFGDGSFSTKQNPSHGYATPGTYTVTLTVASECGAGDTVSHTVTVTGETLKAAFDATASGGVVTFADSSTADSGIVAWMWDFGNGITAKTQNPVYDYGGVSGTYTVTLTVTSACGNTATISQDVSTATGLIPIASYDFIAAVNITPISTGTACGSISAGTFDTGGDGLTTPNSLKKPINGSNQGCDQNSFNVAPPVGDTWISVTEVRFHMKLDFPDGGPAGNNWYTVSAVVYGPSDPGGTTVYSHLYMDTYGLQMAYAEVIVPINYIHQVTSIDILNVWQHAGFPFDNAPGSYLANMTVYGLVTH